MKSKLLEHLASIFFVTVALLLVMAAIGSFSRAAEHRKNAGMDRFGDLTFVNFDDPFQVALLKDVINLYYPGRYNENDSLYNALVHYRQNQEKEKYQNTRIEEHLDFAKVKKLSGNYISFLIVYLIVMALTYYGVETLAVLRFTYKKRRAEAPASTAGKRVARILVAVAAGVGTILLFSPAYVIVYFTRSGIDTANMVFLALFGVVSNGVLITYANKFYSFLVAENRKGYVETAIVKNCSASYSTHPVYGIPLAAILSPKKRFKGHVFDHIFRNVRFQYLATIKEQASFIITGLIISEMALNIQGHLVYRELFWQLKYRNYSIAVAVILGIFYAVKATEIAADYLMHRETLKYDNG
jgi:hypothetical protein